MPTEPVKKGINRDAANISAVGSGATLSTGKRGRGKGGKKASFKVSKRKTGFELRFHKWDNWDNLSDEQKAELIAHREANSNYSGTWKGKSGDTAQQPNTNRNTNGRKGRYLTKAQVASLLKEHIENKERASDQKVELIN